MITQPAWVGGYGRVLRFAFTSATGLAIDVALFACLIAAGLAAGLANLISATVAVTFVYFASVRRIFSYQGNFLLSLFCLYLVYQIVAVSLASWAVHAITASGIWPLLAKVLILPATFGANYLFMSYITRRGACP